MNVTVAIHNHVTEGAPTAAHNPGSQSANHGVRHRDATGTHYGVPSWGAGALP